MEKGEWFPFKGTREKGETNDETAIREIYEETCTIVDVSSIDLDCHYSTKRKHYHIGLIQVDSCIMTEFYKKRAEIEDKEYLEKTSIKAFALDDMDCYFFHTVTKIPIQYYYNKLSAIQQNINNTHTKTYKPYSHYSSSLAYNTCSNRHTNYIPYRCRI